MQDCTRPAVIGRAGRTTRARGQGPRADGGVTGALTRREGDAFSAGALLLRWLELEIPHRDTTDEVVGVPRHIDKSATRSGKVGPQTPRRVDCRDGAPGSGVRHWVGIRYGGDGMRAEDD